MDLRGTSFRGTFVEPLWTFVDLRGTFVEPRLAHFSAKNMRLHRKPQKCAKFHEKCQNFHFSPDVRANLPKSLERRFSVMIWPRNGFDAPKCCRISVAKQKSPQILTKQSQQHCNHLEIIHFLHNMSCVGCPSGMCFSFGSFSKFWGWMFSGTEKAIWAQQVDIKTKAVSAERTLPSSLHPCMRTASAITLFPNVPNLTPSTPLPPAEIERKQIAATVIGPDSSFATTSLKPWI